MTIIVGIKDEGAVYLGCDSLGSSGTDGRYRKDPKIFMAHGIGYGFAGSYRMGQILKHHMVEVLDKVREEDTYAYVVECLIPTYRYIFTEHGYNHVFNNVESGGFFIIAIDGCLFQVQSDFQVQECLEDYDAMGCGDAYALGSFFTDECAERTPIERIINAVEAAKYFSIACGGETLYMKVGEENKKPKGGVAM